MTIVKGIFIGHKSQDIIYIQHPYTFPHSQPLYAYPPILWLQLPAEYGHCSQWILTTGRSVYVYTTKRSPISGLAAPSLCTLVSISSYMNIRSPLKACSVGHQPYIHRQLVPCHSCVHTLVPSPRTAWTSIEGLTTSG